jgi:cytochrome c
MMRCCGVGFAALATLGACGGNPEGEEPARLRQVILESRPGEPIALAVLPNQSVLFTTRGGDVRLFDATRNASRVLAQIPVYTHDEEGLAGIALDPAFPEQPWVYVYYAPPLSTPPGDAPETVTDAAELDPFRGVERLSRFRFAAGVFDLNSEQVLLEVPTNRGACCHVGGQIDFDAAGNLYLSTGDDTNPFASSGYSPLDDSVGRSEFFDARRSAGNSNDLRGKLLRIHVEADGSITIPEGNLFAPGEPGTRPEIYLMGLRNPYRFSVDRVTGVLYLADYSPDARTLDPARGPAGTGKWAVVRAAGNYGWPYCATATLPYVEYDFATSTSGATFDCAAPQNRSRYNTGISTLPPTVEPEIFYTYARSARFPELGLGQVGPMAGPAYHYDARAGSDIAWPVEYDNTALFYEWTRGYILPVRLDEGQVPLALEPLAPDLPLAGPIDLEFGPDGALYVLEYGTSYFRENPEARLSRIEYR